MAEFVVGGGNRAPTLSNYSLGSLQREEPKSPPKPDNYDEAISKILDALKETPVAKELQAKAAEMGKDFAASVEGKVIIGSSLGGALAAIIATNSKLPMQIPELPLDFIAPGLKAKITWEGPVQQPTNAGLVLTTKSGVSFGASYTKTPASGSKPEEQRAGLSLTIPLGGSSEKKKGGPTASEKYRTETARIAAEQEQFRAGMKTPGKKNDDKDFVDSYVRSKVDPTNPLGLPPLKKKEDLLLMRKAPNESSAVPATAPSVVDEVLQSSGEPLEGATRALMEERFGYDFGRVRVHRDARASQSAREVSAHAYTVGHHLVFDAGRYAPETHAGQRLLAHELTHVVQQSSSASPGLQRDDKPPAERVDVAIVFSDDDTSMREGRSYATTALRVTSCADAKQQLAALGKPIGTIYVVSHSNSSGEIQIDSQGGKIMVKLSECSKDLKGLAQNIAPTNVDFRGCKLGEAPQEMENFRQNVGAQTAQAGNCWSIVKPMHPVTISGVELKQESQIPEKQKAEVDGALKTQINSLTSDDGRSVKNCIIGLARGETADGSFAKLRKRYFEHKGNLTAGWASPELNNNWQKGSICVKDMTADTKPCNIVTTKAAAAAAPPPAKKQSTSEVP